ncbi:MAG: TolC family protein, partial [Planctomycetes bacterium]|nr:TolC family protein [Planctomycetota bacterium]
MGEKVKRLKGEKAKRFVSLPLCLFASLPLMAIILWNCETIAQEKPTEEPIQRSVSVEFDTTTISLTLKESILFAIRNNFDVEIARLNPEIGDLGITIEKSKFDPTLKVEGNVAEDERWLLGRFITGSVVVLFKPARTDTDIFKSTIEKPFETGGKLSIGYGFNYTRNVFEGASDVYGDLVRRYTSFVEAKLTQPLLKGGWLFYNLSPVYIARNNKQISTFQFKNTVIQTVDQVQEAYWNLIKAIEDLRVARKSLERAKDLLEKNKLQVEAGMLTPIDVLEAEAGVASREEAVISAENEIKNKEDILKQVINLSDDSILSDASIVPVDKPVFDAKRADMPESIKLALQNRPDLFETQKKVGNAEISIKQRKNELLPQMDINGTFRYDGIGGDLGESNKLVTDMD